MRKLLFILALFSSTLVLAQPTPPAPPPPAAAPPPMQSTVGQLQNNSGQVQSKSFQVPPPPINLGGSKVKPNPFMQTADFALIQNPTFETGFRMGLSAGFSKSNYTGDLSFGANALFTLDLTQRAISVYMSNKSKWYTSYNFAQIGKNQTNGITETRIWKKNKSIFGAQIGFTFVDGETFRISSPTFVGFFNHKIDLGKVIITPELYTTISDIYYNRDESKWQTDFTFNALAGSCFSFKLSKKFFLNVTYRANINTNPKFGLMNNILLGSNFKF